MDQDDLEDELIWKTVVAHFDMVSEKISYRVANQVNKLIYVEYKFQILFLHDMLIECQYWTQNKCLLNVISATKAGQGRLV